MVCYQNVSTLLFPLQTSLIIRYIYFNQYYYVPKSYLFYLFLSVSLTFSQEKNILILERDILGLKLETYFMFLFVYIHIIYALVDEYNIHAFLYYSLFLFQNIEISKNIVFFYFIFYLYFNML